MATNRLSILLILGIFIVTFMVISSHSMGDSKLLIILLDGFRWDYLEMTKALHGFSSFSEEGSRAHHLVPVFPSQTYPNLYSILTGLFPESHGFISEVMYDGDHSKSFYSYEGENGQEQYWWNQTDPIWITTTMTGLKTAVYAWPGCAVKIHNIQPYTCQSKTADHEAIVFETNLQDALTRLARNEIHFALVYVELAKIIGYYFGPKSMEMNKTIERFDSAIGQLATRMENWKLEDNLNVIILSNHGMTEYPQKENEFSIFDYVESDDIEFLTGFGTEVGVYPKADKINKVYEELKTVAIADVWKTHQIPEKLHIKWHQRTPPILVVAKPGYAFERVNSATKQIPNSYGISKPLMGLHGYDPSLVQDMNGIFLVKGPAFSKNVTVHSVSVVDVYNMMTCVLNITGHPNNGSWEHICPLMAGGCNGMCNAVSNSRSSHSTHFANLICLTTIILMLLPMFFI